jgi:hypothetical protein
MYDELLYPVLLSCCSFIDDKFWKFIFEDLAYGKTPYGTYIYKGFFCCNYKNKEFNYRLDMTKSPEILTKEIHKLLHDKFGLLSILDKSIESSNFNNIKTRLKKEQLNEWKSIKKKNIRIAIIQQFVVDMKKEHNLSLIQAKELLYIIMSGIVFKTINSNDIIYSELKIHSINGIGFEDGEIINNIDIKIDDGDLYNFIQYSDIVIDKKLMYDNWEKYLANI